ncbi:MAG: DUF502 domain-containing protein [Planctomycetota bacterium]|nr:DUF502 domain-containing protein [Planctomycetota bacterium]
MATDRKPRTPSKHFKRFFLRGLAVVLPSALTLWLLVKAYQWVDSAIAQPINRGIQWCLIRLMDIWPGFADFAGLEPSEGKLQSLREGAGLVPSNTSSDALLVSTWRETNVESWWNDHWYIHIIGLIVAIFAVYIAGRLVGGFIGRLVYRYLERLISSIPVVKKIYSWVKQVVDFLFGQDQGAQFSRVVAAEYPRRGVWSVGFQTGRSMRTIAGKAGDSVTVFIPSSPTPFTGYTITVPQADIIELPISVEEAIGFAVSGGVLCPPSERGRQVPALGETGGDGSADSQPSDEDSP